MFSLVVILNRSLITNWFINSIPEIRDKWNRIYIIYPYVYDTLLCHIIILLNLFCNVQIHFYVYGNKKRNCISSFQCGIDIDITYVKSSLLFTNCVMSSFNFVFLACMWITDHNYLTSRLLNQSCSLSIVEYREWSISMA